ncbi:hypothetical protein [Acetobacter oeni]|uniref:hypothetical protein n=1 Tax=Acetobacter oeni TaxID=304077 RepID=UPI00156A7343|nr:hypothetical protein [Acetobacter oeni]MBB3884629.1 hypothetical protein [Acetobacter oeni]NHO20562.1 hypothetical protein [Acetobacter oeni]
MSGWIGDGEQGAGPVRVELMTGERDPVAHEVLRPGRRIPDPGGVLNPGEMQPSALV